MLLSRKKSSPASRLLITQNALEPVERIVCGTGLAQT